MWSTLVVKEIFVVGDLHADIDCATRWVARSALYPHVNHRCLPYNSAVVARWSPTNPKVVFMLQSLSVKQFVLNAVRSGLVDLTAWTWMGKHTAALVFMGDYVDRGPFGKQVLAPWNLSAKTVCQQAINSFWLSCFLAIAISWRCSWISWQFENHPQLERTAFMKTFLIIHSFYFGSHFILSYQ